jgi:hypothetical protein
MYELVDPLNMKKGETYFINRFDNIEVIFVEYQKTADGQFAIFTYPNCPIYFAVSNISVSMSEEYKRKLKQEYIIKCLDIVFKRLVDKLFK